MRSIIGPLALVFGLTALPVRAQSAEREVLAVVERLFDGMRARDTAAMRALFHPDARMVSATMKEGVATWTADSPAGWLASVARPRAAVLDERISNPVVRVDGPLASVWVDYSFYLGERFLHCGVDAFHLVKGALGWQIVDLADTRRTAGCPGQPNPPPESDQLAGMVTVPGQR